MDATTASALMERIQGERPDCHVEVRVLIDTKGEQLWYVWVTNPATKASIAVFDVEHWTVLLHELV